jgi:LacI family transcriptional regulator
MNTKPTIYTLAAQAGVSIATISRAFNNSPRISDKTRARILQLADEIGYQPSASARNLAIHATEALALVFPQISSPFFSEFIRGAESAARNHQYHLLVYSSLDANVEDPLLRLLPSRTDGVILGTHTSDPAYIQQLRRQHFPFLALGRTGADVEADGIHPDNEGGSYRMVAHLVEQHGYQAIAYINGPEDQLHSLERLSGFQHALNDYGIPENPDWLVPGDFNEAGGYRAAQQLLTLQTPPRVIFAANDQMAIGAMSAAEQLGLRIPEDLAVVGFDDIPTARYLHPPLTTVNLAIFDQGTKAVELLIQRIADPERTAEVLPIPTTLVIRRSCGCQDEDTHKV